MPADPESPDGPLTPRKVSESEYLSMEWPPDEGAPQGAPSIQFLFKITKRTVNITSKTLAFEATPIEDTIHPRTLSFDPPLQQFGNDSAKGFRHYWEKLDYVFALPDPSSFPKIRVRSDDRDCMLRFIEVSLRLARFSVINNATRLRSYKDTESGNWHLKVLDYPSDEAFLGASALFRQLHNDREPASFKNAHNALFKAMGTLPETGRNTAKNTVLQWKSARGKLMHHTLHTLTALKAGNATLNNPVSYGNINRLFELKRAMPGQGLGVSLR